MEGPLGKLFKDRKGAVAVEYSLILTLIVLATIGGVILVADTTVGMWKDVSDNVQQAG